MTSRSKVFSRQPSVMSSAMGGHRLAPASRFGVERDLTGEALGPGAGLKHVIVGQPFDDHRAAVEQDRRAATGQAAPRGGSEAGGRAAARGLGDADAAFPD